MGVRALGLTLVPAWIGAPLASQIQDRAPLRAELTYAGDLFSPVRGGESRDAVYLDNLDLMASLDLDALLGLGRVTIRAHVQSNRGAALTETVGDFQGASNIEAPDGWRLYELWVETNPVPGRLSVLAGVFDLNAEIDVIPVAGDFLHSSFGFGPDYSASGRNGPSTFPLTTLGIRLKAEPWDFSYVTLAVSDGAPGDPARPERSRFALGDGEGALLSWELGYRRLAPGVSASTDQPLAHVQQGGRRIGRGRTSERLRTKLAVGLWTHTGSTPQWDDGMPVGSRGGYALAEQLVAYRPGGAGISVFGRAGLSDDRANRIHAYLGGGLVLTGPLEGRRDDVAGLGIAHARNGTPYVEAEAREGRSVARAETAIELFYAAQVTDWLRLQPDVQWIIDPGMVANRDDALVFGLRGLVTLSFP